METKKLSENDIKQLNELTMICPDCFWIFGHNEQKCNCEVNPVPFCGPNQNRLVIGYLRLFDEEPLPFKLLKDSCNSINIYPPELMWNPEWLASRLHNSYSIWLWNALIPKLLFDLEDKDGNQEEIAKIYRALSETSLLLIDATENTSFFKGKYSHFYQANKPLDFLDYLNSIIKIVETTSTPLKNVCIIGKEKHIERLEECKSNISAFFPSNPKVDVFHEPLRAVKSFIDTNANIINQSVINYNSVQLDTGHISIIDIGGGVGRELLSHLNIDNFSKKTTQQMSLFSKIIYNLKSVKLIRTEGTEDKLRWRKIQNIRSVAPGPQDNVPSWKGLFKKGLFKKEFYVTFELDAIDNFEKPTVKILGIGSNYLKGERQIAQLLEKQWKTGLSSVILLAKKESDQRLIESAKKLFQEDIFFNLDIDDLFTIIQKAVALIKIDDKEMNYGN